MRGFGTEVIEVVEALINVVIEVSAGLHSFSSDSAGEENLRKVLRK